MRLIIAIIGVMLAGGAFFWYTKPAYDNAQVLRANIAQYDAALDKAAELQSLKQSLLSRFNTFNESDIQRLQKLLPDHVDNVRLILDLDNLAADYGIALQNVDVSSSQKDTVKGQTALGAIGASNQKYDSLTFTFSTTATYTEFVQFLTELESSLRIVDLVSLSIASGASIQSTASSATNPFPQGANPTAGARSTEPLYTYNITLRTYWLK
ncbi:hypothetical protein A2704_05770 [Candidatus Kaiserbacteria bacterium RIFCSPHIGHO2_01_FULL_54_36b]|uniref:Pilus assembly protein PilO n=1 Tax=Candidatus Kaiserbacteria bacterium RIFCSPHIGHO2_01_FULL_54_36b TaxID=1798483 RepID=A0A1F6CMH1_9BACT|nr:MAG: hypothetical protein A2704_05770 [Candidatus Kaiserbacteria bacterium RIFCSPHIGHO2_01_FULL_54_36b]